MRYIVENWAGKDLLWTKVFTKENKAVEYVGRLYLSGCLTVGFTIINTKGNNTYTLFIINNKDGHLISQHISFEDFNEVMKKINGRKFTVSNTKRKRGVAKVEYTFIAYNEDKED